MTRRTQLSRRILLISLIHVYIIFSPWPVPIINSFEIRSEFSSVMTIGQDGCELSVMTASVDAAMFNQMSSAFSGLFLLYLSNQIQKQLLEKRVVSSYFDHS